MQERKDTGQQFAQLPIITTPSGGIVLLGDIATIHDGYEETDYSANYNGVPAIMLQVYRVGQQTPIGISDTVKEQIKLSNLPEGIQVEIRYDASVSYAQRIDLLLRNSAMGLTLVFITLALFLELRLAFWVMTGIPIAFLGSFLILPALGVSLAIAVHFGLANFPVAYCGLKIITSLSLRFPDFQRWIRESFSGQLNWTYSPCHSLKIRETER
jgi:multidrug efflux pump subunit AcrB